jgi:hypothetical protein
MNATILGNTKAMMLHRLMGKKPTISSSSLV